MLAGCGPHANRIYLPALRSLRAYLDLALVIDLKGKESDVRSAVAREWGPGPELRFIDRFPQEMPAELDRDLSSFVARNRVTGVIIATEPLVHRAYGEWALRNRLSILMDKPISARADSAKSISSAAGILDDYLVLLEQYRALQRQRETIFTVNSQRRFHAGFKFVEEQLKEIGERTNCPVTFIHSYHCDGQWRFPAEIVTQDYHPYCSGYGKASHSGYHIFDMLYRLYMATGVRQKTADSMEIVSSFIQPNGFIRQLSNADYRSLFGESYLRGVKWSDDQLQDICRDFGEIDLSAIVTLKQQSNAIANFSVNLVHNGFARRTWLRPGADLYKGNGRVRHENHNIQQGPFQNIQIHSYQANDKHDEANGWDDAVGGKNHFDVYVFRNPMVSGDSNKSLRVYRREELFVGEDTLPESALVMERAKYQVVDEFVQYLAGRRPKAGLRSQIEDHLVPVQLMSGVYRSHVLRSNEMPCVVTAPFGVSHAVV